MSLGDGLEVKDEEIVDGKVLRTEKELVNSTAETINSKFIDQAKVMSVMANFIH